MSTELTSFGKIKFVVWPAYVGVCQAHLGTPPFSITEPAGLNYQRGQIEWRYVDECIVGRARIVVPRGNYTHFLYFQHPTELHLSGMTRLAHPLRMTLARNVIDVDPIINDDFSLLDIQEGA